MYRPREIVVSERQDVEVFQDDGNIFESPESRLVRTAKRLQILGDSNEATEEVFLQLVTMFMQDSGIIAGLRFPEFVPRGYYYAAIYPSRFTPIDLKIQAR